MKWICFSFLSIILSSCFQSVKFDSKPKLEFESFEVLNDSSAVINLTFEDGEGDIGLNQGDTLAPYDPNSRYHYNMYLVYMEKKDNGGWDVGLNFDGDSIIFNTRLLPVYTGKPKGIKGTIQYALEAPYYNVFSAESDTFKYRIQIIDRALNESDWIETQPQFN